MNGNIKTTPEEIGFKIVGSALLAAVSITLAYTISSLFVFSAQFQSSNTIVKITVSVLLTTILPFVIYQGGRDIVSEFVNDLLKNDKFTRGNKDRTLVFSSLGLVGVGTYVYISAFSLLSNVPQEPIQNALMNDSYEIMSKISFLYADLLSLSGFGVAAGAFIIAWYRYTYPRRCQNCGHNPGSNDICDNCGNSVTIPSRRRNFVNFITNGGIRAYTTSGTESTEMDEE